MKFTDPRQPFRQLHRGAIAFLTAGTDSFLSPGDVDGSLRLAEQEYEPSQIADAARFEAALAEVRAAARTISDPDVRFEFIDGAIRRPIRYETVAGLLDSAEAFLSNAVTVMEGVKQRTGAAVADRLKGWTIGDVDSLLGRLGELARLADPDPAGAGADGTQDGQADRQVALLSTPQSSRDLLRSAGLPDDLRMVNRLDKRLARQRERDPNCYQEFANPKKGEARFLYYPGRVWAVVQDLKTSVKRHSTKKPGAVSSTIPERS